MAGPLYRDIARDLRRKINSGELAPGEQLPTEDELMTLYRASRNTVRGAIKELSIRGLVDTQHGKGTFVVEDVPPIVTTLTTDPTTGGGGGEGRVYTAEVAASGRKATTAEPPRVELQKARPDVADALRLPEGSEVVSRHEERLVDGRPWSLQTSFYPRSLVDPAPRLLSSDDIAEGAVNYLRSCGIEQAGYRDSIEVRKPRGREAEFFGIPSDGRIEITEIYRVGFDQHYNRVRLTITVYRADRNRFVINVGNVPISENLLPANGGESD